MTTQPFIPAEQLKEKSGLRSLLLGRTRFQGGRGVPKRFGDRQPRPHSSRSHRVVSPSARRRVHYDESRLVGAFGGALGGAGIDEQVADTPFCIDRLDDSDDNTDHPTFKC
ncbi:hypothetical protein ACYFX5_11855 [Bremerella sp. T1]|uniref:hypothetical protein n=1 Tax=Bremerella sp. TYQ1 TaxID=3119568 RepID=UPI001CCD4F82|nr:hypothetical protein [Bremerella volcania]UBM33767.1 hypothetical protein LA756_13800 [Bremerella volcania]